MFFQACEVVAAVSRDMTLLPGDIIACGTSLGSGPMADASNTIEIVIDGVGRLVNKFDQCCRARICSRRRHPRRRSASWCRRDRRLDGGEIRPWRR